MTENLKPYLSISAEVADALARNQPVVALESTIVTHGMPWPQNVETARQVETDIRDTGGIPATIVILGGKICVGLDDKTLVDLGQAEDVMKLSRADLAFALAMKRTGSTTVAATMIAAQLAGIEVFATGGIGGVHQGAETTFDVSADLDELAVTPVAVIAAGAKAILDIPKTLEYLETRGVPVVAYQSDEFPAFWSRSSGLPAPLRLDTARDIAATFSTRKALGLSGGMLVANPVPVDAEIPADVMAPMIAQALADAVEAGITAKEVTPFVLGRIFEISDGRSLATNIALVRNNARLATEIAIALTEGS
ncbi:MAG: pseudouridine-5'-phosphate glycosidase [Alphaproteobacteria bacterium]|jgi:pseudouridylate synthase|nr:pseudouridine-5'-phosphate glycosidase [Alphaproteobacteria bacterium]MBT4086293.1 pseudouridine-5'-phosphate glycosidase [Alphaproteobacteria bacterium]MBT4543910.1 pseudouridine-5'-phosphate glycosidase [Alphaproteobacteria bacterium]MBT6385230.1 pseudouridine-5'-phosphate glycosidase [Alphaproteobacteria bacterium]MBT7745279.1 pseudouridine-5'-phosphate glycosidase [Alphaproteobacteria bacterium]